MNADLVLLTPTGVALALGGFVPLTALLVVRARARRVRAALGLPERPARLAVAVLLAAAGLLGLAATQPVLERTETRLIRADAEAYVVVDVTRSMLARTSLGSPPRIERAKDAAAALRDSLSGVPVGIASLTDRVLPHLFPSADEDVFRATLERTIGIERPPPRGIFLTNATRLEAIAGFATFRFFSAGSARRLLVVLTDGESQLADLSRVGARLRRPPGIDTVFVQLWDPRERVFTRGVAEAGYRPDPAARSTLDRLAAATGGSVFAEDDLDRAAARVKELVGDGPRVVQGERTTRLGLAPYLAGAAFLPVLLLLRRRER